MPLWRRFSTETEQIKIVKALLENILKERAEFQIGVANILQELFEQSKDKMLIDQKNMNSFYPYIRKMLDSRETGVMEAWGNAIISSLKWLSIDFIENNVGLYII